jgi:hypothetical protein
MRADALSFARDEFESVVELDCGRCRSKWLAGDLKNSRDLSESQAALHDRLRG